MQLATVNDDDSVVDTQEGGYVTPPPNWIFLLAYVMFILID